MSQLKGTSIRIAIAVVLVGLQLAVALAQAEEAPKQIVVVEVRKKLQLTSKDPVIRDYYVNAGISSGLKAGAFVTVNRRVPLADPNRENAQTHVEIPVGIMRVIFADSGTAIGRIQTIRSAADSPILDSDVFMVGDRLDMSSLGFERTGTEIKSAEPTKSAATESPAVESRATASEPKTLAPQAKSVEVLTK